MNKPEIYPQCICDWILNNIAGVVNVNCSSPTCRNRRIRNEEVDEDFKVDFRDYFDIHG